MSRNRLKQDTNINNAPSVTSAVSSETHRIKYGFASLNTSSKVKRVRLIQTILTIAIALACMSAIIYVSNIADIAGANRTKFENRE